MFIFLNPPRRLAAVFACANSLPTAVFIIISYQITVCNTENHILSNYVTICRLRLFSFFYPLFPLASVVFTDCELIGT